MLQASLFLYSSPVQADVIHVGNTRPYKTLKSALSIASAHDTIYVDKGLYKEGNIEVLKPLTILGIGFPVFDGEKKGEVFSIRSWNVTVKGIKVIRSGSSSLEDYAAIKVYNAKFVNISDNLLEDNFFAIYLQNSSRCIIKNNKIVAYATLEQEIGDGIHCWKSDTLEIAGNYIKGHRDGIYFEFVEHSVIWRNTSEHNIRYGLHFMFSGNDIYVANHFDNNGAGVAVMFSKNVSMFNNTFSNNQGTAAYGLLLKELSDGYISGNKFIGNTYGIYMEGASRMFVEKNQIRDNGWGMTIQASCMDNKLYDNNFTSNTFDISTNGSLVLNTFTGNYWDKYEGYDLDRNGFGDVPYHPLSLFSVIAETNPPAMILYRSFMVALIDKSERLIPSLTPENFVDEKPRMRAIKL